MPKVDIQWKAHRDGDGRGLLTDSGDIYVWPEDEQTHMSRCHDLGFSPDEVTCFYIGVEMHPRKAKFMPPGHLNLYELDDEQDAAVLEAMPTLNPPPRWNGERVAPKRKVAA